MTVVLQRCGVVYDCAVRLCRCDCTAFTAVVVDATVT